MRVYKFLSARWAREAIFRGRLKISLLNALNDPWDGRGLAFSSTEEKHAWERVHNQMAQAFGMACFSLDWDDPVMWSHYADQHRGVAIGFDVQGEYTLHVTYQENLVPLGDVLKETEAKEKVAKVLGLYSTKYVSWRYEREVRLFCELNRSDEETGHFFKTFDRDLAIREVIFGAHYNSPEEMASILSRTRGNKEISCKKAALGNTTFKLALDPNWQQYKQS